MRFIIQQVSEASITIQVNQKEKKEHIQQGAVIYVGISKDDCGKHQPLIENFAQKIQTVKLFNGGSGSLDSSLNDIQGSLLIVSNFTLYSRNKKGNGVDYTHSAPYGKSQEIYADLIEICKKEHIPVKTGKFGAMMTIKSTVVGPVNHIRDF